MTTINQTPIILWGCCVGTYQAHENDNIKRFGLWLQTTRPSAGLSGELPVDPIERGATPYYSSPQEILSSRIGSDFPFGIRLAITHGDAPLVKNFCFVGEAKENEQGFRTWVQVSTEFLPPLSRNAWGFACSCGYLHQIQFVTLFARGSPTAMAIMSGTGGGSGSGS